MDKIRIKGGVPLEGVIPISGAKNAALPLMALSLLTSDRLNLENVPDLADIATMANLLVQHGVTVSVDEAGGDRGQVLELSAAHITSTTAPYDLVRKMRASILVLGPLLARCGRARVSLPGGCAIGPRPVDLHIKGLQRLGAEVELHGGYIDARAPKGLKGAEIAFPVVSVGATENLLMAATLAEGETLLINAAREPEITDLATNSVRKLSTDSEGKYESAGLRAGDYKVMIAAAGFANVEISGVTVRAGDVIRADARLTPAGANQTVLITAERTSWRRRQRTARCG